MADGAAAHACGTGCGGRDVADRGPANTGGGAATVIGEVQPDATMVVPKEATRSATPAAQVMAPDVGRT